MDCWKMKMSIYFHKISLKIPLLRHWSIWESMYYSTYLAPRLGIWKENEAGKIQLRKLIQECGISLENSE